MFISKKGDNRIHNLRNASTIYFQKVRDGHYTIFARFPTEEDNSLKKIAEGLSDKEVVFTFISIKNALAEGKNFLELP